MNRRTFLKSAGAVGAGMIAKGTAQAKPASPKQVIILLGESVRADMLNSYRKTGIRTPNLDRLAAEGIRFDRAYNCQPVCSPARSAIWTGMFPHSNGVTSNSMPLGNTVHTLGQRLHDGGVHCAFIGKWHIDGFDYFGTGRPASGWDPHCWYDMRDYLGELSPDDRLRSRQPSAAINPGWPREKCFAHRCTERALDFLTKHKGEDYLMVLAFDEPHGPSLCPKEYIDQYSDFAFPDDGNLNDSMTGKPIEQKIWAGKRLDELQNPMHAPQFFGSHTFVDEQIGRVLDEVERSAQGALVIYTSDHGVFLGSHHLQDKGPAMYDEITRIPLLVRWPGVAPKGTVCSHLASHVDISGTVMDYFGIQLPKTMEGSTMLATFRDPSIAPRSEIFMEWERYAVTHDAFGAFQPIRCIRSGRYKLSIHLLTTDELYDLEADPAEMKNLIDLPEHAAIRNALHDKLLNWMNETRDSMRGYYWGHRAWRPDFPETWENAGMRRQRESDGYLPRELDYNTGLPIKSAHSAD